MSDDAITRSEEELRVGTEWRAVERVRVRRRVVEEEISVPVTVRREELVVEREPVDGAANGESGAAEDEIVMVLREERPVVSTEVVPRERVRVFREVVAGDDFVVEDEVRRERVELERES